MDFVSEVVWVGQRSLPILAVGSMTVSQFVGRMELGAVDRKAGVDKLRWNRHSGRRSPSVGQEERRQLDCGYGTLDYLPLRSAVGSP